jgi:hypothetical protein
VQVALEALQVMVLAVVKLFMEWYLQVVAVLLVLLDK